MRVDDWSDDRLDALTDRIVQEFHPLRIVLFGSRARGEANEWSDVDLLVVLPRLDDYARATRALLEAIRPFEIATDIVVTTPAEIARRGDLVGTALRPALRDGRVLYASDETDDRVLEMLPVSEPDRLAETRIWLGYAREDLRDAETYLGGLAPRNVGYLAQQAGEKALKSVWIFLQIQYPFTHNLNELRDHIPAGWPRVGNLPNLRDLTEGAVSGRYPGGRPPLTEAEARSAVALARLVVDAVTRDLTDHGFSEEAPAG